MEWLSDVLREPLAQVVEAAISVLALALAARIRGKQKRAHDSLRESGVLPPK